jgi:hypothetical protein
MKTNTFKSSSCHSYDDRTRKSHGMTFIQKHAGGYSGVGFPVSGIQAPNLSHIAAILEVDPKPLD